MNSSIRASFRDGTVSMILGSIAPITIHPGGDMDTILGIPAGMAAGMTPGMILGIMDGAHPGTADGMATTDTMVGAIPGMAITAGIIPMAITAMDMVVEATTTLARE